jgi:hypothetical protein
MSKQQSDQSEPVSEQLSPNAMDDVGTASKGNSSVAVMKMNWKTIRRTDLARQKELELWSMERRVEFAELGKLLRECQWEKADYKTYELMTRAKGERARNYFTQQDLEEFPWKDLRTIDWMWLRASHGRFGFSVQKKIWQECNSPMVEDRDWTRFSQRVGWANPGYGRKYKDYHSLKMHLDNSPLGELPLRVAIGERWRSNDGWAEVKDGYSWLDLDWGGRGSHEGYGLWWFTVLFSSHDNL